MGYLSTVTCPKTSGGTSAATDLFKFLLEKFKHWVILESTFQ